MILQLPREVIISILENTDYITACKFSQTCTYMNDVASDTILWKSFFYRRFSLPFNSLIKDYKSLYKLQHSNIRNWKNGNVNVSLLGKSYGMKIQHLLNDKMV